MWSEVHAPRLALPNSEVNPVGNVGGENRTYGGNFYPLYPLFYPLYPNRWGEGKNYPPLPPFLPTTGKIQPQFFSRIFQEPG